MGKSWVLTENSDNATGFKQPFSTARSAGKADGFVEKKPNFHQNQIRESNTCEGENLQVHEFNLFGGL